MPWLIQLMINAFLDVVIVPEAFLGIRSYLIRGESGD